MKTLDYVGTAVLAFSGFTAFSHFYLSEIRDVVFPLTLVLVAVISEWSARLISRSMREDPPPASDSVAPASVLTARVRRISFLLSFYVPTVTPINWKLMEAMEPPAKVRRIVSHPLSMIWILFGSFIALVWLVPFGEFSGPIATLLQGSIFGLLPSFVVATYLTWWSLTFFLFKADVLWRNK